MKKIFIIIICSFLFLNTINAEEFNFIYSEWIDYYPSGVEEFRIVSEDRYLFERTYTDSNGNSVYEKTSEYYTELEGYTRIESSKKTFYKVINNSVVFVDENDNLVTNTVLCIKSHYCKTKRLLRFIPSTNEVINEKIEIDNPKTGDNINTYLALFMISTIIMLKYKLYNHLH